MYLIEILQHKEEKGYLLKFDTNYIHIIHIILEINSLKFQKIASLIDATPKTCHQTLHQDTLFC